jgi:selenocysteine lyase/cysteine desulfurase
MYGRSDLLEELKPYKVKPAPVHPPDSWERGTRDQAKFAAIKGVVDHHAWLAEQVGGEFRGKLTGYKGRRRALKVALTAVEEYEKGISRAMLEGVGGAPGLNQMPHIKVYGITDPERVDERDPTFSFEVEGVSQDEDVRRLRVHEVYERPRLIRASFVQYNTLDEAEGLLRALADISA